jgi:hypothetical protein
MPFVPVQDVAEVVLRHVLHGQNVINVLHFKRNAGWTGEALLAFLAQVAEAWKNNILGGYSNELSFVSAAARLLTTASSPVAEFDVIPDAAGGAAVSSENANVALCIGLKTGLAGRSFRGRCYMAGVASNQVTNSLVDEPHLSNRVSDMNNFKTAINNIGVAWGVVSKYSGYTQTAPKFKKVPTPRAQGIFTPIVSLSADRLTDSMRRRLPGRGN